MSNLAKLRKKISEDKIEELSNVWIHNKRFYETNKEYNESEESYTSVYTTGQGEIEDNIVQEYKKIKEYEKTIEVFKNQILQDDTDKQEFLDRCISKAKSELSRL